MNAKAAVLKTTPETVISDYSRLLELAGFKEWVRENAGRPFCVLLESFGDRFYPAASVPPWQVEGFLNAALPSGVPGRELRWISVKPPFFAAAPCVGQVDFRKIFSAYGVNPSSERAAEILEDRKPFNLIVLSTVKTHLLHAAAGAVVCMSYLSRCPRIFPFADEILEPFRRLREAGASFFGILDGTFAGDGAGPLCLRPFTKNVILAGSEIVGLDAVSARMMGFEPFTISYLRKAHEQGLGCARLEEMNAANAAGEDVRTMDFRFHQTEGAFSRWLSKAARGCFSSGRKPSSQTTLKLFMLERLFEFYTSFVWFPRQGQKRFEKALETRWGRLLKKYSG